MSLFEIFVISLFFFSFLSFVFVGCVCVKLWKRRIGATKKGGERQRGRGEPEQQKTEERGKGEQEREKKKEERDEKGKQHEKQLEGVSLLECNLCKSTLVVEVCRHRHELLIVVKVWSFHRDFLIF
jgi:hypothetical protein